MNYQAYSLEAINIPNSQNTKKVLRLGSKEFRKLKNQEILIKHKYIGMNFYDIDICRSIIKKPDGFSPGIEAMGEIVEIGKNLKTDFKVGDRVCYCTHPNGGSYGEYNIIHENYAIFVPKYIQDHMACAVTMRGVFAFALLNRVFRVDQDCYVLIFNPTGGLGHILSQLAKYYGAYVISVLSRLDDDSNYDESLLKKHGADLILDRNDPNLNKKILSYTGGKGVNVIYDTIGDENLLQFAPIMQYCGLYASIGQNCGVNLKVSMHKIGEKSIFLTRPSLFHYKSFPNDLRLTATEIFELMKKQVIEPYVNNIYSFNDLKEAHKDMINRKTRYINLVEI